MTDEALSLKIAEFLEPMPTSKPRGIGRNRAWSYSDESELQTKGPNAGHWMPVGWQPRNMVTDPAMTVMLMEKLLSASYSIEINTTNGPREGCVSLKISNEAIEEPRDFEWVIAPLGRAVAETFESVSRIGKK